MKQTRSHCSWNLAAAAISIALLSAPQGSNADDALSKNGAMNIEALRSRLTPLGWRVERSEAGDVFLWPPEAAAGAEQPIIFYSGVDAPIDAISPKEFRQHLEAHGWSTESGPNDTVIFTPPARISAPSKPAAVNHPVGQLVDLLSLLRLRGWDTQAQEDGSFLLAPPCGGHSPTKPRGGAKTPDDTDTSAGDHAQLRRVLEQRGWSAQPLPDGSVLLVPNPR